MSLVDDLSGLSSLFQQGVLSLEQFEAAKNKIIGTPTTDAPRKSPAPTSPVTPVVPVDHHTDWSIHVFWDIANCRVQHDDDVFAIVRELKDRLRIVDSDGGWDPHRSVFRGQFYRPFAFEDRMLNDLRDLGFSHVNPGAKRGGDDHKMIADIMNLADDPALVPEKIVVVVITSDRDFCNALRALAKKGFNKTVLVHSSFARRAFVQNAAYGLDWEDIKQAAREEGTYERDPRRRNSGEMRQGYTSLLRNSATRPRSTPCGPSPAHTTANGNGHHPPAHTTANGNGHHPPELSSLPALEESWDEEDNDYPELLSIPNHHPDTQPNRRLQQEEQEQQQQQLEELRGELAQILEQDFVCRCDPFVSWLSGGSSPGTPQQFAKMLRTDAELACLVSGLMVACPTDPAPRVSTGAGAAFQYATFILEEVNPFVLMIGEKGPEDIVTPLMEFVSRHKQVLQALLDTSRRSWYKAPIETPSSAYECTMAVDRAIAAFRAMCGAVDFCTNTVWLSAVYLIHKMGSEKASLITAAMSESEDPVAEVINAALVLITYYPDARESMVEVVQQLPELLRTDLDSVRLRTTEVLLEKLQSVTDEQSLVTAAFLGSLVACECVKVSGAIRLLLSLAKEAKTSAIAFSALLRLLDLTGGFLDRYSSEAIVKMSQLFRHIASLAQRRRAPPSCRWRTARLHQRRSMGWLSDSAGNEKWTSKERMMVRALLKPDPSELGGL
eukprot:Sspe_Gene.65221::Locus_38619_Transcript_1_1_Confidence_1.000_Length_2257::g.65221::m.65221